MSALDLIRSRKTVAVAHGEAFQLMLYCSAGNPDLWIWNSRDGVTPFGFQIDGAEYRHAMNSYRATYTAVLPDEAQHVWVDYDRSAWEAMQRSVFARHAASSGPYGGAAFLDKFPTPNDWLAITPFEHGSPRRLSRAEFLEWTTSYIARATGEQP